MVLGDLAEMGYDARWGVLGANDAGAPHRRKRLWLLAALDGLPGLREQDLSRSRDARPRLPMPTAGRMAGKVADSDSPGRGELRRPGTVGPQQPVPERSVRWPAEPALGRVAHELADGLDGPGTNEQGDDE